MTTKQRKTGKTDSIVKNLESHQKDFGGFNDDRKIFCHALADLIHCFCVKNS